MQPVLSVIFAPMIFSFLKRKGEAFGEQNPYEVHLVCSEPLCQCAFNSAV